MPYYYPVGLDLTGKVVLLVGGGTVAEGKIDALLEANASVTLVSPEVTSRLADLAAKRRLSWKRRTFAPEDLIGAFVVIAATDQRDLNARIAALARSQSILVNAVDDAPNCDFIAMSVIRRGELQVAISTGGASPAMARWVREELEAIVPDEFGPLLEVLGKVRAELKGAGRIPPYAVWSRAITPELLALVAAGDLEAAGHYLRAALGDATKRTSWTGPHEEKPERGVKSALSGSLPPS